MGEHGLCVRAPGGMTYGLLLVPADVSTNEYFAPNSFSEKGDYFVIIFLFSKEKV